MPDYYVATTGNDTTGDGSSGNPWATPGKALGEAITAGGQWNIYVKEGTYTLTTSTENVSGGRLNFSQTGSATAINRMVGYASSITDGGKFTLQAQSGSNATVVTFNNANSYNELRNVEIVGNSTSGARAINLNGRSNRCLNLYVRGFTGGGTHIVEANLNSHLQFFRISGGATNNFSALHITSSGQVSDGIVEGNAGVGVNVGSNVGVTLIRVISCNHTGANGFGFQVNFAVDAGFRDCVAYSNAQTGFHQQNSSGTASFTNCVSYGNLGRGWNFNSAESSVLFNCAYGSNTSGDFNATPNTNVNPVSLGSNPFAGAGSLDFTPGTALQSQSMLWPFLLNAGLSTTYSDIGAIQSLITGGSGGVPLIGHGGLVY